MFVKRLSVAAAVKVTSECWVLVDLDWGVLKLFELMLFESKEEGGDIREWGTV